MDDFAASSAQPERRNKIAALEKAFAVLETFGPDSPSLRIVDISARTGINRSSVQRLAHTLVTAGWLNRDDASGLLSLSHRTSYPAHVFLQGNAFIELVMPQVVELNARTGASCDVWLLDDDAMVLLARAPSPTASLSLAPIGSRRKLFETAPGRALLAALPACEAERHLAAYAQLHGTDAAGAFTKRIASERERGYAMDAIAEHGNGEVIATAFRDATGRPIAVLSLSGDLPISPDAAARMLLDTSRRLEELRILRKTRPANLEKVARVIWPSAVDENDPLMITAVSRALHLIQFFHPLQPLLSLTELSRATGLPIPTVQRITDTLIGLGYLEKDPLRRTFSLSVRWLEFLYRYQMGSTLMRSIWPRLVRLREECGLRCSFCILDRTEIVYLLLVQSRPHPAFRSAYPGYRLPAVSSSGGRAMLARLPDAEMECILAESIIEPATPHTITDKNEIRREILVSREQYMALTDQQTVRYEVNIAAPVMGADGRPLGAIVVSAPIADWSVSRLNREIFPLLREYILGI